MPVVKARNNPRVAATQSVSKVLEQGQNLTDALGEKGPENARDAAFARHLAYGVLRWLGALDWLASKLLKRPLKGRDQDVHRLILLGLFQLWKDESAEHAAINETAECARLLGKPWAVGLVNAVLRRFQREKDQWLDKLDQQDERFSHPGWLIQALRSDWPDEWQSIVAANNEQAGLWLRVNRSKSDPETVCAAMKQAGFETMSHEFASDAIRITPPAPVEKLPGFREGDWSVQDPAAQLALSWLDVRPGDRILDACAAPGGKTCHVLEAFPDARVVALDRSESRLERLWENAGRLGLTASGGLEVSAADALDVDEWWDGALFDRILLDAPCTATGVIRRHPEIKWLRNPEQVRESVSLQAELLMRLWPLLKPGGILVYATCSVLGVENREQISQFIEKHDDATPVSPGTNYGRRSGQGCQILPGESEMDGFFYARLKKAT